MEIRISEMKKEITGLNSLIEEYELTYLNLYNTTNSMSSNWQDGYANNFFSDVEQKKIKVKNTVDEMKNLKELYNYIVNKYITLGNKITFDLRDANNILNKINNYIIDIKAIINAYQNLNLHDINKDIIKILESQSNKLKELQKELEIYQKKLKNVINFIEETEKKISLKITSIKIETIVEQNIEDFI